MPTPTPTTEGTVTPTNEDYEFMRHLDDTNTVENWSLGLLLFKGDPQAFRIAKQEWLDAIAGEDTRKPPVYVVTDHNVRLVMIHAPHWFERQDFLDWLGSREEGMGRHPATWFVPGFPPHDSSDVFVTYDCYDGSDAPADTDAPGLQVIPSDIWEEICDRMDLEDIRTAVLWIKNIEPPGE